MATLANSTIYVNPHGTGSDAQLYALEVSGGLLFAGGYLNDTIRSPGNPDGFGTDQLYGSSGASADNFTRLTWSTDNAATGLYGPVASSSPWYTGTTYYEANDPAIARVGSSLLMFVSAVPFKYYYYSPSNTPDSAGDPLDELGSSFVGLAKSVDGGATWAFQGAVGLPFSPFVTRDTTVADGQYEPTVVAQNGSIDLWYSDLFDANGVRANIPQLWHAALDSTGLQAHGAAPVNKVLSGGATTPLILNNADVSLATDGSGTEWMIGQAWGNLTTGSYADQGDLVAYFSTDGMNWTPWDGVDGTGILVVDRNHDLFDYIAPSVVSAGNGSLTIQYSVPTQIFNSNTNSLGPYDPLAGTGVPAGSTLSSEVFHQNQVWQNYVLTGSTAFQSLDVTTGAPLAFAPGVAYGGGKVGVSTPLRQWTYHGANQIGVAGYSDVYIINDAQSGSIIVTAGSNVLRTGSGSGYFLTGGSGTDTFDVSVRENSAVTVANAHRGDAFILRDYQGFTSAQWLSTGGAPGNTGPTLDFVYPDGGHFDLTLANVGGVFLPHDPSVAGVVNGSDNAVNGLLSFACFAGGTRILAVRGEVAVEALRVGDVVLAGLGRRLAPVRWIGHRRVSVHGSEDLMPVRVRAEAFGAGCPHADLRLSPDHAVYCDGGLIPIRYLVNGVSVVQENVASVTYWHVELDRHDVVLAEGLPVESFLDTGNRGAFSGEIGAPAAFAFGRWEAAGCAPLVLGGPRLTAAVARLAAEPAAAGQADDHESRYLNF